jgi:hypothetical protein
MFNPNNSAKHIKRIGAACKTSFLIAIILLPALYFIVILLAKAATFISEDALGVYEITFRPFMVSILLLLILWVLSLKRLNTLNKFLWHWAPTDNPSKIIYAWLKIIFTAFGVACLAAGLMTVLFGPDNLYSMFHLREEIFFIMLFSVIICPVGIGIQLTILSKNSQ